MINYLRNLFGMKHGGVEKGFSEDWLKTNEKNFLALGGNTLTQPMRQSYVVHRCVKLISDTAPKAPLNFYRGINEVEQNHQLRKLFAKPSKHVSFYELISNTTMFYSLYGESYWYFTESFGQSIGTSKYPSEIIVVDPRGMKEVVDKETGELKGWMFNGKIPLNTDEIIHFKSNNPYNPYRGLSPLDSINFEMKSDYKASEFQEKFFVNGAVPGFVLTTHPDDNTPEKELQRYSKLWDQNHKGVSKSHKTAVLRGGMDFKVVGLTHREMAFIESRVMTRDIILETFGVPKAIFGATEEVNRATAEVQERVFWETTIQPLLLRIQAKLNAEFLYFVDPSIEAKFDFTKIPVLQNLYQEDVESVWKLSQVGYSRNELNKRFDLGFPEDTEHGDDKYMMLNLVNIDDPIQWEPSETPENYTTPKPENDEEDEKMTSSIVTKASTTRRFLSYHLNLEKMMKKKIFNFFEMQKQLVLKRLTKSIKSDDNMEIYNRLNDIWDNENVVLVKQTTPIMIEIVKKGQMFALENMGIDRDVIINRGVVLDRLNKITGINTTVWNQIKMNLNEGIKNGETIDDIAERIKNVYSMAKKRSLVIARTEVTASMNLATIEEYKENNVREVEWLTAGDSKVRDSHMQNAAAGPRPVGTPFPSGETYPSAPNCRCCLSPHVV